MTDKLLSHATTWPLLDHCLTTLTANSSQKYQSSDTLVDIRVVTQLPRVEKKRCSWAPYFQNTFQVNFILPVIKDSYKNIRVKWKTFFKIREKDIGRSRSVRYCLHGGVFLFFACQCTHYSVLTKRKANLATSLHSRYWHMEVIIVIIIDFGEILPSNFLSHLPLFLALLFTLSEWRQSMIELCSGLLN